MPLEIDQDPRFQRTQWVVQRITWLLITIIIAAALLGVFGSGKVSNISYLFKDTQLEYKRFLRQGRISQLHLITPAYAQTIRISINKAYLDKVSLERLMPEAEYVSSNDKHYIYYFNSEVASSFNLMLEFRPRAAGILLGELEVNHTTVNLWHPIFP